MGFAVSMAAHAIGTRLSNAPRLPADQVLGEVNEGFRYAQVRLSPARLSHCMRWFGTVTRADEIARAYATTRKAFGKLHDRCSRCEKSGAS